MIPLALCVHFMFVRCLMVHMCVYPGAGASRQVVLRKVRYARPTQETPKRQETQTGRAARQPLWHHAASQVTTYTSLILT